MFTGIIESIGTVKTLDGSRLILSRPSLFSDIKTGSSVAVAGVCLSVVAYDESEMCFDVVPETFAKTTLQTFKKGKAVNLERALSSAGRFDGHVVQGHVEGIGTVRAFEKKTGDWSELHIGVPEELLPYIVPKGSIALDGVSLTIAKVQPDGCLTVALIPHTLEHTTLGVLKTGQAVNIETDIFVRALIKNKFLGSS